MKTTSETLSPQSLLAALRAECDAATPGIWRVEDYRHNGDWRSTGLIWAKEDPDSCLVGTRVCEINCDKLHAGSPPEKIAEFEANAAFIASARTSVPMLIDALEEALNGFEMLRTKGTTIQSGASEADARDVTAEVMRELARLHVASITEILSRAKKEGGE